MNEIKKLIIVLSVIALLIIGIVTFSVIENNKNEKVYAEFEEKFNGETNTLVYIGRPTCGYCNLLTPSLQDMKTRYGFDYVDINIDEISDKNLDKILEALQVTELGTPYLAIVSNGKVVDVQNGYADYDVIFEFLKENSIIKSDAELLLNYIDVKEYNKLIKGKEASVIVVGQSTCSYCVKAKVVLNEVASKNDIEINYLNLSYMTEDDYKDFTSSFEYFQSSSWGTPVTMIVKNGKIVDMLEQFVTEEEYTEFFKKNGVL